VEVYFPDYGWIPFEPTPGEALPEIYQPDSASQQSSAGNLADIDPFDEACFDEFDICGEEDVSDGADLGSAGGSQSISLTKLWPWALGVLAALTIVAGVIRWFWQRFMAVPGNPSVAFQRLSKLASLASAGPADHQTPYQFGSQLRSVLPAHEAPVSLIVDSYVRNRYGNKTPNLNEQTSLSEAWKSLRLPMLWTVITRRVR
jgi:hypothetical protein